MILYTLNDRTRSLGLFPFAFSLGLSQAPFLKPKAIGLVFIRRKERRHPKLSIPKDISSVPHALALDSGHFPKTETRPRN